MVKIKYYILYMKEKKIQKKLNPKIEITNNLVNN